MARASARLLVGILLVWSVIAVAFGLDLALADRFPATGDDILHHYYPGYEATYRRIANGELPLWNPHLLCGSPWLASLQLGVLYPPHVAYLLLPLRAAFVLSAFLHLALVATATVLFLRRIGIGIGAALFSGLLLAIDEQYMVLLRAPNFMEAAAWLPVGALAALRIVRRGDAAAFAALGLSTALSFLAGYPQASLYCIYAWGAVALIALIVEGSPHPWRSALVLGLALAAGGLAASIQMLPALDLASVGTKHLQGIDATTMAGNRPVETASMELDALYRAVKRQYGKFGVIGWLLPLLLWAAPRQRRWGLGCAALGGILLVTSLGPDSPLFPLYRKLPLLDIFRYPQRLRFVADFFLFLALAVAADLVVRGAFSAPAAGSRAARWVWLAIALLLFGSAGQRVLFERNDERLYYASTDLTRTYDEPHWSFERIARVSQRVWFPGSSMNPVFPPNLAVAYGLRGLDGYEPANLRRHAEYFGHLQAAAHDLPPDMPFSGRLRIVGPFADPETLVARRRLIDLAAVRYVLVPRTYLRNPAFRSYRKAARLQRIEKDERGDTLFENPGALPRAYVSHRVEPAPPVERLLPLLAAEDFDPRRLSYAEGLPQPIETPGAPADGAPAQLLLDEDEHVEVGAVLKAPGLLVLADAFEGNWKARRIERDGNAGPELPILPANHLFRGVLLPAGRHRIRFDYEPSSLRWGAAASAFGGFTLLVASAAALRSGWRRNPTGGPRVGAAAHTGDAPAGEAGAG